ncbi:MAG: hypothetical protein OEY06_12985 [Gammaproteobacteria bacterium]|nr:hypothetical protein [Gammaproteobacteria bacterium]
MKTTTRTPSIWTFSLIAIIFGIATIKSGGSVLFIDGNARLAAGHYVPFVLWFNFSAGFVYIIAGLALWLLRPWSAWLSLILAFTTLLVFVAFGLYILNGAEYEIRTVIAMTLRSTIWAIIAAYTWHRFLRHENSPN